MMGVDDDDFDLLFKSCFEVEDTFILSSDTWDDEGLKQFKKDVKQF